MKKLIPASRLEEVLAILATDEAAGGSRASLQAEEMISDGWRCGGIQLNWRGDNAKYGVLRLQFWRGHIGAMSTEDHLHPITVELWGAGS